MFVLKVKMYSFQVIKMQPAIQCIIPMMSRCAFTFSERNYTLPVFTTSK